MNSIDTYYRGNTHHWVDIIEMLQSDWRLTLLMKLLREITPHSDIIITLL